MVMSEHDQVFAKACRLLDKATKIWETKDIKNYDMAEKFYAEAVFLKEYHFDNKKELTEDLCPF
jgi:hypothetical protein